MKFKGLLLQLRTGWYGGSDLYVIDNIPN